MQRVHLSTNDNAKAVMLLKEERIEHLLFTNTSIIFFDTKNIMMTRSNVTP